MICLAFAQGAQGLKDLDTYAVALLQESLGHSVWAVHNLVTFGGYTICNTILL